MSKHWRKHKALTPSTGLRSSFLRLQPDFWWKDHCFLDATTSVLIRYYYAICKIFGVNSSDCIQAIHHSVNLPSLKVLRILNYKQCASLFLTDVVYRVLCVFCAFFCYLLYLFSSVCCLCIVCLLCCIWCDINYILINLQNLWTMLDKHQSPPLMPDEQMINYEDFLKVAAASSDKCR